MKFLVASVGNRLESHVAKKFEHAVWYLFVDSTTHSITPVHHMTPHDRHDVLARAVSKNVDAVIAGKFADSSLRLLRAMKMRVVLVRNVSVVSAIESITANELPIQDAAEIPFDRAVNLEVAVHVSPKKRRGKVSVHEAGYVSDSPRGHHHLQQYGGRGH